MKPRRRRWIWVVAAVVLLGAGFVSLTMCSVGCGLYEVPYDVNLQVIDARTRTPVAGAVVFVGHPSDVENPERLRESRAAGAGNVPTRFPDALACGSTDAAGRAHVRGDTRLCQCISTWQEWTGTVPNWLSGWSGVSVRIEAPGHTPRVLRGIREPRREVEEVTYGYRHTVVVLDLGTIALDPE